jgi:hypothetical protein
MPCVQHARAESSTVIIGMRVRNPLKKWVYRDTKLQLPAKKSPQTFCRLSSL